MERKMHANLMRALAIGALALGRRSKMVARTLTVLGFVVLIASVCDVARSQAPVQGISLTPQYFRIADFKLQSGEVLKEMVVEYATLGEPKRDASGAITNGVINPHGWSGNYQQSVTLAKDMVGPGRPLDPQRFFIIFPTALGSPGSSSPSVSGLGPKFPAYSVADMVTAQYRLVTEHLGIKKLAGVMGASMGGYQTLQWITQYPDMMRWAVPIAASMKSDGRNLGIFGLMSFNIRTDPVYQNGEYKQQPKEGMRRGFMSTYLWYFGAAHYDSQFKTEAAALKGLEDAGLGSDKMDANDIIWRNNAMGTYNVAAGLPKVKAKVLVVGVVEDELFPPQLAIQPIADAIPGAKAFFYESPLGHLGCAIHIARANTAILEHIASSEKQE
jgi:homoserine O-acetyltransferase